MARQYYNVNTQTKLIDTHKQFNGGLKTVDTDDALRDFYLRQAENVSISEFGFLEKRYGLAKKGSLITGSNATGRVQGHHKFNYGSSTDEILAVHGKLYVKEHGQTAFTQVSSFATITGQKYPDDTTLTNGFTQGSFQTTRDIGMARIKDNLFIFTGTYPLIYTRKHPITKADLSNGTVYAMHYYVPSFVDLLASETGLNLLIGDDFDDAMGYSDLSFLETKTKYQIEDRLNVTISNIDNDIAPAIPTSKYTTTYEGDAAQIKLEATVNLKAPASYFKKFAAYDHNDDSLVYQAETFNPQYFYLASGTAIAEGDECTTLNQRVSYSDGNTTTYFVCVVGQTGSGTETNQNFQLAPHSIQYRETGASTWENVPEENIVNRLIYSNADSTSDFSSQPSQLDDKPNITTPGYSFLTFNTAPTTEQELNPLHIVLKGFPSRRFDFKVEWHFERHYMDSNNVGHEVTLSKFEVDYLNVEILPEKIDFDTFGFKGDALITCNKVMERDGRLLAYGSTSMPEHLFFSSVLEPNWFPTSFSQQVDTNEDDPIQAIVPFMSVLVILTQSKIFGLKGSKPLPAPDDPTTEGVYQTFAISPVYGTIAPKSVRPVRNRLYFLSREGIVQLTNLAYATDEKYNVQELDRNIKNIVPRDVDAVAIQHDYQYWINFPSTGETLRYYVEKKAWVKDTYGKDSSAAYDFDGVFKYYSKDGVLSFITNVTQLDTSGPAVDGVYEVVIDKSLPSDFTKTIKSTFETANLNQGYPFHPKKYLESRLDFTLQNEYNTSKDEIAFTASDPVDNVTTLSFTNKLLKGHSYQLGFAENETITNVRYQLDGGTAEDATYSYIGTQNEVEVNALYFDVPYEDFDSIAILITHTSAIDFSQAALTDNTFDHTLNFNTFSLSEEGTLNFSNTGYTADDAKVEINLGTVFGENETWVFDESAFDDRVTAVKTVKLSGRGYNYKLFVTDRTKAKWTIENLGVTFKLKRARSR
jgi:hypothetical protein